MANFTPSFTKQFTNTCQTLTITDTSNYGFNANDEHFLITDFPIKRIVLRDIFGVTLTTKDIESNGQVTFDLTLLSLQQIYLNISLELGGFVTTYNLGVGAYLPCII